MENTKTVSLADKVCELIAKYQEICVQNDSLRNELIAVKAQNEALNSQLGRLEEDMTMKNVSEDDIFKQIEAVLNK